MKRVVAPGAAWTTVGATALGRSARVGFGTTLALAWLPSRRAGAGLRSGQGVGLGRRRRGGGAGGELLLGVGRQVLVLLPLGGAVGRRHLLRLLVAQAHLAALGRGEAGPLVHPLGDPGLLLRRQRRIAVGDLQPLLLALGVDARPVALQRRQGLALGRRQRLPAHAGLGCGSSAWRRAAAGRGLRRGLRRRLGQRRRARGQRHRGHREAGDASAQPGRHGRRSHSPGGVFRNSTNPGSL